MSKDQNHGKAWGRLVWRGRPKAKIESIGCTLKKEWSLVETPNYKTFTGSDEDLIAIMGSKAINQIMKKPEKSSTTATTTTSNSSQESVN